MNPLSEMRALFATPKEPIDRAVILEVTATTVTVKTGRGTRAVTPIGVNNYKAGDRVRVQGNLLLGKTVAEEALPLFKV